MYSCAFISTICYIDVLIEDGLGATPCDSLAWLDLRYEMVVGKSPFGGSNQDETCRNILQLGTRHAPGMRQACTRHAGNACRGQLGLQRQNLRSVRLKFPPGLEPLAEEPCYDSYDMIS